MTSAQPANPNTLWGKWCSIPLYLRILVGLVLGIGVGVALGERAHFLELPAQIILRLLGALAPPLIMTAVIHVLMTTKIEGKQSARLAFLLILNTTVAILIGLAVANIVKPGAGADMKPDGEVKKVNLEDKSPVDLVVANIPRSLLGPLGDNQNIIGVIIIAIALGVALRGVTAHALALQIVEISYESLLTILNWIIQLVPIGVFAIVAKVVGTQGFSSFIAMGWFIFAVLLALFLQTCWYMIRIRLFSWPRIGDIFRGMRDALVMAFSTSSSTVTMPLTYQCLRDKVGVREKSASLGALVGANFNNDGTALYEAMAAMFVAQLVGQNLSTWEQVLVVLTSIVASVGAAGIPEAGLVTMTLVFTAVGLPVEYIALLLAVDWFLDRCRTVINVLGDVNVSCLLDGRTREVVSESDPVASVSVEPA